MQRPLDVGQPLFMNILYCLVVLMEPIKGGMSYKMRGFSEREEKIPPIVMILHQLEVFFRFPSGQEKARNRGA